MRTKALIAALLLAGLIFPLAATAQMSEDDAAIDLIKSLLAKTNEPAQRDMQRFVAIRPDQVFFAGDRPGNTSTNLDRLDRWPRDVQRVEAWYTEQIPSTYSDFGIEWKDIERLKVLYLERCGGRTGPGDIPANHGGTWGISYPFSRYLDQARIELALSAEGTTYLPETRLIGRSKASLKAARPDPAILAINQALTREFLAGRTSAPLLLLEPYCGAATPPERFPGTPPELPPEPPPVPAYAPVTFRVQLGHPDGTAYVATWFDAELCRRRKGSNQNTECPGWKRVDSGDQVEGTGLFRFVYQRGGALTVRDFPVDKVNRVEPPGLNQPVRIP